MQNYEEERLVKQTREEVDLLVEKIRLARGTDMDLAFARPEEIERRNDSLKQISAHAQRRFQESCDYVNDPILFGLLGGVDREATINRLHREFERIPKAIQGK
jgi:hypothetical protein